MSETQGIDNNTCVVCFKNVLYFSIGECDHPVCFECSTRMRVLCLQNECPICRQDLSRVVFTDTVLPYKELRTRVFSDRLFERQYKIGFCSEEIKKAYDQLLEHRCNLCPKIPPFRTFTMLNDHMRKVHEKFFCDLCVKHLKIFTSERKCYTRQELAHHRRKGDLDDTSHRGHPLCEFCEERFMDADELYRHLRKEHLYCHLCDADGRNLYYASHSALQQHFRSDHFLCEEGECANQYLTAVFRSDIDLKAHKATVHGRGMPRGAARQARTLELQFNITPHPGVQMQRTQGNRREREREPSPVAPAPPTPRIDTSSDAQFPALAPGAAPQLHLAGGAGNRRYKVGDSLVRNDRNFPALDGSRPAPSRPSPAPSQAPTVVRIPKPGVSVQLHSQPASASNFRLTQATGNRISIPQQQTRRQPLDDDDFPSLGRDRERDDWMRDDHPSIGASSMQPPKVTLINSQEMQALQKQQKSHQPKKPPVSSEAFPALSSTAAPAAPPQWITVSKSKDKNKPAKPEPPPKPREPAFNAVADFPTLPANKSKSKKKQDNSPNQATPRANPQPTPRPNTQPTPKTQPTLENSKQSKKEKKKQNDHKKLMENFVEPPLVNGIDERFITKDYVATVNNNSTEGDKKIKTIESASCLSYRNGGNGDFALAAQDYPPLSAKSANNLPSQKKSERKLTNGSVPPGFKSRPACDGMTFTNSAGQTFSAPVHTYIAPPDFEPRNRALVEKFAVALGGAEAVEDFKVASRAFRDNIISANEFYHHCRKALGSQLEVVFPELVALLPDIAKQQELVVGREMAAFLDVCNTCGQLLTPCDAIAHDTAHWPPLSSR